ncbi:MAG: Periplasmic (NiFeSe) hydrogenase large subunit [Pelotomaculum sp. PtaB.Bin013]|uniref:Nickel-dependent hydrogenase large subunit n=1 Tax=Pelotomaculum isophthalicicum JI TaxID=947010 RepID=A0A9X4H314_9FIRM|nr:nickel-dependent hydrogenase large subunit [Pelotomaculum isophthalicicum]MDF9407683.1 nickel-dependent hydrogenase large subunit [Pelotomaculum isophthalicicum JI]OPX89289.1 MAG: Periplasmic (NiFeSe) hydrogenase large subunit [Pelotomaculum sp. PtaB.Bin013]
MSKQRVMFSPVTRLSGLLSVDVMLENGRVTEANASGTMFRGYEWIMRDRHVTDAVYLTQRICGICSLSHGAVASYLLDELYDNELEDNAQYLRNIMFAADFLQNHIKHFYLFSLPDFIKMPERPPFHGQNPADTRLNPEDNQRLAGHYFEAVKAAQESHQILALFGGKAPHQHSFVHGGVTVAPTADKIEQALALIGNISEFVKSRMVPDTELITRVYSDYFRIGITPWQFLSFGLFRFGAKNEMFLWRSGVLADGQLYPPQLALISEDITSSWFDKTGAEEIKPDPFKPGAYTWVKSVRYAGRYFQVGPLARMIINGFYKGGTATMDRIYARTLETLLLTELVQEWLKDLKPSHPPVNQKSTPVKKEVTAVTDAMRGALLHTALIEDEKVVKYNIITPTVWNFSPKDGHGGRGPLENALVGTEIPGQDMLFTILGRTIRSFDPCISCATHLLDCKGSVKAKVVY